MKYVKATGAGVLAAVAAAAFYVFVKVGWGALYLQLVLVPAARTEADGGLSWDAYYPQSVNLLGPLVVGFVIGFWWMLQRRRPVARLR